MVGPGWNLRDGACGQATAEFVAALVLVAVVLGAATGAVGSTVRAGADASFCDLSETVQDTPVGGCTDAAAPTRGPGSVRERASGSGSGGEPGTEPRRANEPARGETDGRFRRALRRSADVVASSGRQVGGFVAGAADQAGDIVQGTWEGLTWVGRSVVSAEQRAENRQLARWVWSDPGAAGAAVWDSMTTEVRSDWSDGEYGTAAGRVTAEVGASMLSGRVLFEAMRRARHLDTAGDAARTMEHVPSRGAHGTCSFSAATPVLRPDGRWTPIARIEVGDQVLAVDPMTGLRGSRRVSHVWVHDDDLVDLHTSHGTVSTTADHPFWGAGEARWMRADELRSGSLLADVAGEDVTVTGFDGSDGRRGPAYNLTVEGLHTYAVGVGDAAVVVHNTCPTGLRDASPGLAAVYADGSVRGRSIIGIRTDLITNGFRQRLADNRRGYTFELTVGADVETVRVMRRSDRWDVRVTNRSGNYLDDRGNVASPERAHGIDVDGASPATGSLP